MSDFLCCIPVTPVAYTPAPRQLPQDIGKTDNKIKIDFIVFPVSWAVSGGESFVSGALASSFCLLPFLSLPHGSINK